MKKLHALLAAVCLLWTGTACAETALEVAVYPALDQIINAALPSWYAIHPDVKIKIVTRGYDEHHKAVLASISDNEGAPDVVAVEIGRLREFAKTEGFENLAKIPYKGLLYRRKFIDYTFPLAASSRGELIAIPSDIAPGTLFYRLDILNKAGVSEADLTRSWESYVEAGKKIKAATGAFLVARAVDTASIVLRSNLKDGEGVYFDKDGNCLVDTPRFARAFSVAKAIREAKLDANLKLWSPEWVKGFQRGIIATQISGSWFAGYLANAISPKFSAAWHVANIPSGTFLTMGGTYYAIPKHAHNKEMAWEFIKFMTLDEGNQIKAFRLQNAFPALLEAQLDPFFDEPMDFFSGQKARMLWRGAARHIPSLKGSEYDNIARDLVEAEMEKVLDAGKDIGTALKDAKTAIEKKILSDTHAAMEASNPSEDRNSP